MNSEERDYWTIRSKSLFELINGKRKRTNKTPIDNGAIATRLALKAQAMGLGELELGSEELRLESESQIEQLIDAINNLFDLNVNRSEVDRYLVHYSAARLKEAETNARSEEIVEETFDESEGFLTRVKRLFKPIASATTAH
jgi:hypothetical protein